MRPPGHLSEDYERDLVYLERALRRVVSDSKIEAKSKKKIVKELYSLMEVFTLLKASRASKD